MKITVIIPCFNEAQTISQVVENINKTQLENLDIVVVDDCSSDNSGRIIKDLKKKKLIKEFYFHDKNRGKGAAIRTAIQNVQGGVIIIQDADLEYDPSDYEQLLEPIRLDRADVVYGSRFLSSSSHRVLYFWHSVGNKFLTFLSNMFTNLNLSDMETCYKVFRTEIIKNIDIQEDRFGFEPEITAKISKLKCRVYEVGVSYHGRTYEEGKKITWRDGLRAIYCIIRYNVFK